MFSKLISNIAVKSVAQKSVRCAPAFYNQSAQMVSLPQRGYVERLGLDPHALTELSPEDLKKGEVSLWQDQQKRTETSLVLKSRDEIERYVISIVKNYFRTTKKAKVELESNFEEHGLDSLDTIELVI